MAELGARVTSRACPLTQLRLTDAQAYIDITEELWEVARRELPEEIATWPPSLRSDFELLKEDQEDQRERCRRPAQTEPHENVACRDDEGIFGFENDDAASTDEEEDEDYEVEYAWDSEDERRDRSTEADALEAIRMTLRRPEGHVVRAKAIAEDSQLQRSATSEVREEEEEEPQKELRDSPERQEEQKSELEATPTWFARLSMATQSIRYMY